MNKLALIYYNYYSGDCYETEFVCICKEDKTIEIINNIKEGNNKAEVIRKQIEQYLKEWHKKHFMPEMGDYDNDQLILVKEWHKNGKSKSFYSIKESKSNEVCIKFNKDYKKEIEKYNLMLNEEKLKLYNLLNATPQQVKLCEESYTQVLSLSDRVYNSKVLDIIE